MHSDLKKFTIDATCFCYAVGKMHSFILLDAFSFFFLKGVILKPVVYGNVAKYFGKKREEDGHTHQW